MAKTLQACEPCNCTNYGSRSVYNVTAKQIQKWLSEANTAGKAHGINPVIFLAMASIESNGGYDVTDPGGTTYGIVQVGSGMLADYNKFKGTSYALNDLIAKGSKVKTASAAVALSFDILGYYLAALNAKTNNIALSVTGWNGAICGYSGYAYPFGTSGVNGRPVPTGASCYGVAVKKLAAAYSSWWINPKTGQASSFYWGALSSAPYTALDTYNTACYGNR